MPNRFSLSFCVDQTAVLLIIVSGLFGKSHPYGHLVFLYLVVVVFLMCGRSL